jgi:hypothetical protein
MLPQELFQPMRKVLVWTAASWQMLPMSAVVKRFQASPNQVSVPASKRHVSTLIV